MEPNEIVKQIQRLLPGTQPQVTLLSRGEVPCAIIDFRQQTQVRVDELFEDDLAHAVQDYARLMFDTIAGQVTSHHILMQKPGVLSFIRQCDKEGLDPITLYHSGEMVCE